jgi:hypothetical protein
MALHWVIILCGGERAVPVGGGSSRVVLSSLGKRCREVPRMGSHFGCSGVGCR